MSVKFRTVTETDSSYLDELVAGLLQNGWLLHGSLTVLYCGQEDRCDKLYFIQALIHPGTEE